jgi:membrane-bound lytic murein transglycosylase F
MHTRGWQEAGAFATVTAPQPAQWWTLLLVLALFGGALLGVMRDLAAVGLRPAGSAPPPPAAASAPAPHPPRLPHVPRPLRRPPPAMHPVVLRAGLDQDIAAVLPRYRKSFEDSARRAGLDWRLLAAVGYQESRWDPAARSPTGVRGLMMLTVDTADDLGVDREDPAQSILGAGRLLADLYAALPPRIREPDRTAMALAAYNQGLGHLLDARDVTDLRGGNPDHWEDVRLALPLLEQPDWIATTKYGYARGSEAVDFVERVRGYYATLKAAPRMESSDT